MVTTQLKKFGESYLRLCTSAFTEGSAPEPQSCPPAPPRSAPRTAFGHRSSWASHLPTPPCGVPRVPPPHRASARQQRTWHAPSTRVEVTRGGASRPHLRAEEKRRRHHPHVCPAPLLRYSGRSGSANEPRLSFRRSTPRRKSPERRSFCVIVVVVVGCRSQRKSLAEMSSTWKLGRSNVSARRNAGTRANATARASALAWWRAQSAAAR